MTEKTQVTAAQVFSHPVLFLAFGFGSGLAPRAPGTAGTLAAIPLYLGLIQFDLEIYLALLVSISVAGVWICQKASDLLGVHDHGGIVWDEFAGFLVAMLAAPPGWLGIVAGFALFRLFDIWKPWPVSWADKKVHGGLGIMLDDLMAGGLAASILYLAGFAFR